MKESVFVFFTAITSAPMKEYNRMVFQAYFIMSSKVRLILMALTSVNRLLFKTRDITSFLSSYVTLLSFLKKDSSCDLKYK